MEVKIIIGAIILCATIFAMAKRADSKSVLLIAGLLMALIGGDILGGFEGFNKGLAQTSILEPIITAMGFAAVMKLTGCDKHLIYAMLKILRSPKAKLVLLPATMTVTMIINLALNSATATVASIGSIMIPVLIASGYSPVISGGAILASTYASVLNPGHSSNAVVAKISNLSPMAVVSNQVTATVITFVAQIIIFMIIAKVTKQNKYEDKEKLFFDTSDVDTFKVNYLKALIVFVPLILLIAASQIKAMKGLSVGTAMIIGSILGLIVTKTSPKEIMKAFWAGAGDGFVKTFSIVVCAQVFITGMTTIGLIDAMTNAFISNPSIAKISATIGPPLMSIITGTGTGMAVAFNQAVSANAAQFGLSPLNMGSLVTMTGVLGRAVSPVAGVVILTSGLAKSDVIKVIKVQLPGFIASIIILAICFLV